MYDLSPKAVFAHERVYDNPRAVARMERMLHAMGIPPDSVPTVTVNDVDTIVEASGTTDSIATQEVIRGGHGRVRQGRLKLAQDPVMLFNTFVWDRGAITPPKVNTTNPHAKRLARLLGGVGTDFAFSHRELHERLSPGGLVCQGGWGIHTIAGCVHKCDYCGQGFAVNLMLDLEDFADQLEVIFEQRPRQNLYRYDLYSDTICFEPEYGASEVVGERFDRTEDKYLLLYTKSDNVQHLLDLPYRTHTVVYWTLAMDTVSREIERDTPTMAQRIEAMRLCQEAGYAIRAGFSPIIPIANWREETTEMLELLFAKTRPEALRVWTLSMMDADEFEQMFDTSGMDPLFMQRMREEAASLDGTHSAPFPLDVRAEIYAYYLDEIRRISPETPVNLCNEAPELWDLLEDRLSMRPGRMFCCCGGTSIPGTYVPGSLV